MLPPLTKTGDLPAGIYQGDWTEIEERFGRGSAARVHAVGRLRFLYDLASRTGKLSRFLIFGSFVSVSKEPRDVDVVLIMASDFRLEEAPRESQTLFSHPDAEARFRASVFWVRENMLTEEQMREFLETWQRKRDGTHRGIVEVMP